MTDSTNNKKPVTRLLSDYLEDLNRAGVSVIRKPSSHSSPPLSPSPGSVQQLVPIVPAIPNEISKFEKLNLLATEVSQCTRCSELVANRSKTVFGSGNPQAELVFIGEGPGADEDQQGVPFVGRSGQLLTDMITKGMKLQREDVYICNIVRCRPPENRTPTPEEAASCRPFLEATLQIISPKYICCLGATAAIHLLGINQTIGKFRGSIYHWHEAKVICTYHPAYLLRNPAAKAQTWEDIQLLMREMGLL